MNRYPGTVELSVIQKLTGKQTSYNHDVQRLHVYSIGQKQVIVNYLLGTVELIVIQWINRYV